MHTEIRVQEWQLLIRSIYLSMPFDGLEFEFPKSGQSCGLHAYRVILSVPTRGLACGRFISSLPAVYHLGDCCRTLSSRLPEDYQIVDFRASGLTDSSRSIYDVVTDSVRPQVRQYSGFCSLRLRCINELIDLTSVVDDVNLTVIIFRE